MNNYKKKSTWRYKAIALLLPTMILLPGCSDNLGGNETESASVSLSIHIPGATAALGKGAAGFILSDGTNTLDIEYVGLVLREIELERQFDQDCDEIEEQSGNDDTCEKFESGPVLLEPSLDGSVDQLVSIFIPDGVYDELEFDVHKLSRDSQENRAFLDVYPEFDELSIRVEGKYNGEIFVFTQDLMDEQEIDFNPPIEVSPTSLVQNVTMNIDLETWFRTADGTYVNPETANKGGENENMVEKNIKNSIDAFEDDDEDGDDDDDDDDNEDNS